MDWLVLAPSQDVHPRRLVVLQPLKESEEQVAQRFDELQPVVEEQVDQLMALHVPPALPQ